ncbi:polyhydroxyalkanoate depolymerase [Cupriavidus oxalaticus]|uniref:polyhydroxyalkanoate depolymerase n=1 Tax=Cupriavidus oxalaticus TaxID=96344 RepID=UPI00317BB137
MLYSMVEYQRAMIAAWADQSVAALLSPFNSFAYVPGAQDFASRWKELLCRNTASDQPAFGIAAIDCDGVAVPVLERLVSESPFCHLRRFEAARLEPRAEQQATPIVLVCAPLAGHHAVLLRDVVQSLLQEHIVYVTDWTDARHVPVSAGSFHLDDCVIHIRRFIREIDAGPLHVLAICQATVPALGAVALLASQGEPTPRSLTLLGGPIDARRNPTAIGRFASSYSLQWFRRNLVHVVPKPYAGAGRRVCPGFVQIAALGATQVSALWDLYRESCLKLLCGDGGRKPASWQALLDYHAVLDLAADFYLDTVHSVFQEFQLARGTWDVQGQRVRPQDITNTALLTIEGGLDDISGCGQTHAAHDLCHGIARGDKRRVTASRCNHYDLFSGPAWRSQIFPRIRDVTRRYG